MNKKGNVLDWFFIILIVFMTGICLVVAYIIIDKVDTSAVFAGNTNAQLAVDKTKSTLISMDNMMLFVIIGLSVFVLISSALVFNHPAFFIASIFLLFIAVVIAGSISNAFWTFTDSSTISATAALFPKVTFIMNNLPFYVMFLGIAAAVVMYVGYQRQ